VTILKCKLGVAIYNVTDNKLWNYNENTRFPLMSIFKIFACEKLLTDAEK